MTIKEPLIIDVKPMVQPLPEVVGVPVDPRSNIWLGMAIMVLGFGGFLYWAFTAKLDEGAPVSGTVVVQGERKTIQHSTWGVVTKIFVRDGDKVKKGQLLLQLENTQEQASIDINNDTIQTLDKQLHALKPLVEAGYYPRNQYLDLQRQYDDAQAKLRVAREEAGRTSIRAPVSGTVMGSTLFTVGGVVQPGAKLMEIVPGSEQLVLDVRIPTAMIDKIHAGLMADVRLSAFNQSTTPLLAGKVAWVSPDRFQDPQRPEMAYYTARVLLTPESMKKIQHETLLAGMPAEVIIKTGNRTFWNYLVKPIEDRAALALKER
ncbi:HlyD family efflux transporter periplasmic adaptor subunit [Ferrovum sp.]|uniref:HlyD family efflux transporter periplasmic adaptor subunit n=1 Tax=Ferrovum sp. TaxID=2609467 RepID=UPI002637CDEC|nr:HlyD family efflux transporter periplasmic adaptor subunit [Ferrovum sp.]